MSPLHHLLRQHATALLKAGSYYGVHIVVAAAVAYAVTGNWLAALTLSLLEPSVQVVAYFLHDKAWARVPMARYRTLLKTVSYYGVHLVVAAGVAYAVTGDGVAALTLSLLEPTVQMLFFYLHETLWERQAQRRPSAAGPCAAAAAGPQLPVCGHRCVLQHSA
jgi:uncharacterized membrane protein